MLLPQRHKAISRANTRHVDVRVILRWQQALLRVGERSASSSMPILLVRCDVLVIAGGTPPGYK